MRIMSFNIRWAEETSEDAQTTWDNRKKNVASMIRFHHMDIVGLQEPWISQVHDLELLLPEFAWYGIGIEDGQYKGPINAIFYRTSTFKLLDKGFFFLSNTPNEPSLGWDAKYPRGVSWIKLELKKDKKIFYFFNTHFDYHGQTARDESAYLLRDEIGKIALDKPFIVTGDFNLFPNLGGKETYRILTQITEKGHPLVDAQRKTLFPHHGPTGTWSGFKEPGQPGIKPDYIFVSENTTVISHGILSDTFDGQFPSDHLPVVAEIEIN